MSQDQVFVLRTDRLPWECFPADLDTSDFIEMSCLGDKFATFFDPKTNRRHYCSEYYKQWREQMMDKIQKENTDNDVLL